MVFKGFLLNCFIGGEQFSPGMARTWKNQIEMSFAGRTSSDLNWFIFDNPV